MGDVITRGFKSVIARKNAGSASSYLIEENFEGTGTPTGWAVLAGTPDFGYTTTVIDGTKSHSEILHFY